MRQLISFEGKKIIIFGASSGIGRMTAITLSELGAMLVLVARREEELEKTRKLCDGELHKVVRFDVTDIDGIGKCIEKIVDEFGKMDGMVYTVGINEEVPLGNVDYKRLQKMFNSNYFAFVECVRQMTKRKRYNEGFRIVSVSSVSAILGEKCLCAYAGTKAAMDGSVRVMAKELASKGICINTVAPGMTNTDMVEELVAFMEDNGDSYKRVMERQYLGMISAENVANAICFLLSSAAGQITGVTLPVDGGYTSS